MVTFNSHQKGGLFCGCRNTMVLQSHYKNSEHPLALRKGRLDSRLFTSNPHTMELLRYQGLQLPLAWRKGECPDHVVWPSSYPPANQEEMNSLSVYWWLVELPMWLTDSFSVTFFGRWRGQCAHTLIPMWLMCGSRTQ